MDGFVGEGHGFVVVVQMEVALGHVAPTQPFIGLVERATSTKRLKDVDRLLVLFVFEMFQAPVPFRRRIGQRDESEDNGQLHRAEILEYPRRRTARASSVSTLDRRG